MHSICWKSSLLMRKISSRTTFIKSYSKFNFHKTSQALAYKNCLFSLFVSNKNMSTSRSLIAVAQMRATLNKEENYSLVEELVEKAASRGAQMIFLPEGCDFIAESKKDCLEMTEPLAGPTLKKYCHLAKSLKIWLSVGGLHIKEDGANKISNTHIIIDNFGNIVVKYAKAHLFHVNIPEQNINLDESKYILEGDAISTPVMTSCGLVALGICYDVRFPEFSLLQRNLGAQILTFPSAFTVTTGLAHWHALLRARAIETQCYVVAAAQTGKHNSKRSSYGHALVVDPWGTVVAEVSEGNNIALAEIDIKYLEKVRREMPVHQHRRRDLYSLNHVSPSSQPRLMELTEFPKDFVSYPFGHVSIRGSFIFVRTSLSHAFVNKKPFTLGHTLVAPMRPLERFIDLNEGEVSDFSQAIVTTIHVVNNAYSSKSVQVAIQDGKWAGQTVKHLHAHVVPLTEDSHGLEENHESKGEREWKDDEDMTREATALRHQTVNVQNLAWLSSTELPSAIKYEHPNTTEKMFQIEDMTIPHDKIFLYTGKSFAFLPANPILPGHACVCPYGDGSSLVDLSPGRVADLFLSLQKTQEKLEHYYKTDSTTIFIKNSPEKNVCVAHIIPRKKNDFEENDDLYKRLVGFDTLPPNNSNEEFLRYLKSFFQPT